MASQTDELFAKIVNESPTLTNLLAEISYDSTPAKFQFPNGARYRYFDVPKKGRRRAWMCCWSTTANANKRYLSWIYEQRSDNWIMRRVCEHRRRKDAKARAIRLADKREAQ